MIIIGEKLNSSIPSTMEALKNRDEAYIIDLIQRQAQGGADFLDLNAAMCMEKEAEVLSWLVGLVLEHSKCGVMVDSPSPEIVKAIVPLLEGREIIVNSVTITERFEELIPFSKEKGVAVVGLPIDDEGVGETLAQRLAKIDALMAKFQAADFPDSQIYLDVVVETLAANPEGAAFTLESIKHIKAKYPQVKTTCGLSNISFGLPKRVHINSAFAAAAVYAGLDSAIIDNTNQAFMSNLLAAEAVAGRDANCLKYIKYQRKLDKAAKAAE